ncbi:MAG: hypothetical protein KIS94_06970 [Chitinophagales bacterium]|nr:hypothetical protein [Chitinophagales bacterium]
MIIIAESGSTKTNWLTQEKQLFETIGFNPMFHSTEFIFEELNKNEALRNVRQQFTKVYFYGASCSSAERNKIVSDALQHFFEKATVIEVDHDLKAAAVATYTGKPGIACILGTGSNSCLYDGKNIHEEVPALGYVLGDEGSGAWFGKRLMALFLYHKLPPATEKLFKEKYKLEKEKIFDMVYRQLNANRALAVYAKVLDESPDKDFMSELVKEGFREFFKYHVACYKNYEQYPVHFVGSIAFIFKTELEAVAQEFGSRVGIVDRNPVYRLLEWHLR